MPDSRSGSIELVVVEDGGQGIESAKAAVEALRSSGVLAKVVYVPLSKSGRCMAGNKALEAATGQLCCFLDDDDLFYADHLEVLVEEWSGFRGDVGQASHFQADLKIRDAGEDQIDAHKCADYPQA